MAHFNFFDGERTRDHVVRRSLTEHGCDYHYHATNEYPWTLRCYRGNPMGQMTMGHTYNNAAGGNDCCFEKQCIAGVYQTGVNCMAMSCVP